VRPDDLILLGGSATTKLVSALRHLQYAKGGWMTPYDTLDACVRAALLRKRKGKTKDIILFSPGAASFEKFKNEFHRGETFARLIKGALK
jgi:UDP-N-acetylmuramoylalanine--D-glutamate ligase